MDTTLRQRGMIVGGFGIVLLFSAAIALVLAPNDYLVYILVPLAIGLALIAGGYILLSKAEKVLFEREVTHRKP